MSRVAAKNTGTSNVPNGFQRAGNRDSGSPSLKEIAMRREIVGALAVLLAAATTYSQSGMPPSQGTFVTAEEIETVVKAPGGGADREIKIVDVGRYNVGVAVLRRGALKPGGTLSGINHTKVTEVYYV